MIDAYQTDIVMAVRTNNVRTARELYNNTNNNKTGTGNGNGTFIHGCNACNRFGESILHIACRRGHVDMVEFFLVTCGFQLNVIRDDYFRTPFHDAFWTSKASTTLIDFLTTQQQTPNSSSLVA